MNVRDLEYILALDRHRSFSKAASECGVAQPTLSAQVRKLEDRIGVALFERDGREIRTTAAGASILEQARAAVDAIARIEEIASAHTDPRVGPLRIGVIPTLAPYILPGALPEIATRLPHAPLVVVEDLTERLLDGLRGGHLDAAIIATTPPSKLTDVVLFDEALQLALPADHELAQHDDVVPIEHVSSQALILLADGHCLADQAVALCREAAQQSGRVSDLRATSLETVLNLVDAGLGMTIIPALARVQVERRFPRVAFRELQGEGAFRRVRIVHRAFSPRRHAIAEIGDCVKQVSERSGR